MSDGMLPGLGMIPLAISSKFSNSLASCSAELPPTDSIPLIPPFTLDAPDGASRVRRPQRISAHGPRNRYPVLTGFLAGRRQICPTALQQPDLQALVCLISPKKGINIREHCSQVPINPHRGRWPLG